MLHSTAEKVPMTSDQELTSPKHETTTLANPSPPHSLPAPQDARRSLLPDHHIVLKALQYLGQDDRGSSLVLVHQGSHKVHVTEEIRTDVGVHAVEPHEVFVADAYTSPVEVDADRRRHVLLEPGIIVGTLVEELDHASGKADELVF